MRATPEGDGARLPSAATGLEPNEPQRALITTRGRELRATVVCGSKDICASWPRRTARHDSDARFLVGHIPAVPRNWDAV
jgi:hypothetical protein